MSARTAPIARQRRHTLAFLEEIRSVSPVFLSADVDMTRVTGHRAAMLAQGRRYSLVTYVLHAAARVVHEHPEANSALVGRLRPRVVRSASAHGKLTLDKTLDGQRIVLTAVLPDLQRASLDEIHRMSETGRWRNDVPCLGGTIPRDDPCWPGGHTREAGGPDPGKS